MSMRPLKLWIVAAFLLSSRSFTDAQERPNENYQTNQFNTSTVFRQNVCDINRRYIRGEIPHLKDALDGLELRTVVYDDKYLQLDDAGALDEGYPGLVAVLLDELARRAGCTWRNTYALYSDPIEGKGWTDILQWTADTYDVSSWFIKTIDRMGMGINFMEPWYDASMIMVGKHTIEDDDHVFNMFGWTDPFNSTVWCMIVATIILSCLTYMLLDKINFRSDRTVLYNHPGETLFLTAMAFTSQFDFTPRTNPTRLFAFSLSFWSMMVSAAYMANLFSFLVVKNTPAFQVKTVGEAVQIGLPLCVYNTSATDLTLTSAHPNAHIIRHDTTKGMFEDVLQGECDIAVTTVSTWDTYERDASIHGSCNLEWIGRPFQVRSAGFATRADSSELCTSFIRDVLDYHLFDMKATGFVEEAWIDHLARTGTIDCKQDPIKQKKEDPKTLNMKNLGGIFVLHWSLSLIAVICALMYRLYSGMKGQAELELDHPEGGDRLDRQAGATGALVLDRRGARPEPGGAGRRQTTRRRTLREEGSVAQSAGSYFHLTYGV